MIPRRSQNRMRSAEVILREKNVMDNKKASLAEAFFASYHLHHPQDHAVDGAAEDAVEDDGAGDGEDLGADAEDEAFGFGVDGGGDDRVCKAGDGDERARARVFCDVIKHADAREQRCEEDQRDRDERIAVVLVVICNITV